MCMRTHGNGLLCHRDHDEGSSAVLELQLSGLRTGQWTMDNGPLSEKKPNMESAMDNGTIVKFSPDMETAVNNGRQCPLSIVFL